MYAMKIWGSAMVPGKDEISGMSESQVKIILWDRFPGGFKLLTRPDGAHWIIDLEGKKRVGEIVEVGE